MGKLYNEFLHMDEDESIGMVQEQTLKYMRAFGSYHIKSPSTKLGRPPSKGNPGFNPDLMVMDLVKLRADTSYKSMIHELKVNIRIQQKLVSVSSSIGKQSDKLCKVMVRKVRFLFFVFQNIYYIN